jgi:hypothetical protein
MKVVLIAALTCLSLALAPDAAFAAKKRMKACTAGQVCASECVNGLCTRNVCNTGGKWEKRLDKCMEPFCAMPKC